MKKLTLTFLTCLIFLSPNVVLSETMYDLVIREDIYYKKFSEVPFTGKITGRLQGSFKNGKKEGAWIIVNGSPYGEVRQLGQYKAGKRYGAWVVYFDNNQVWGKGRYQHDKQEGPWIYYFKNGNVESKGKYKTESEKVRGLPIVMMKEN